MFGMKNSVLPVRQESRQCRKRPVIVWTRSNLTTCFKIASQQLHRLQIKLHYMSQHLFLWQSFSKYCMVYLWCVYSVVFWGKMIYFSSQYDSACVLWTFKDLVHFWKQTKRKKTGFITFHDWKYDFKASCKLQFDHLLLHVALFDANH